MSPAAIGALRWPMLDIAWAEWHPLASWQTIAITRPIDTQYKIGGSKGSNMDASFTTPLLPSATKGRAQQMNENSFRPLHIRACILC